MNCQWQSCKFECFQAKDLFDHIVKAHVNPLGTQKNDRMCRWDNCQTVVKRRHHMISHMRIHVDYKPFPCAYCDQRFKWRHDAKRHSKKCTQRAFGMISPISPHSSSTVSNIVPVYSSMYPPQYRPVTPQAMITPLTINAVEYVNPVDMQSIDTQSESSQYYGFFDTEIFKPQFEPPYFIQ